MAAAIASGAVRAGGGGAAGGTGRGGLLPRRYGEQPTCLGGFTARLAPSPFHDRLLRLRRPRCRERREGVRNLEGRGTNEGRASSHEAWLGVGMLLMSGIRW